MKYEELQYERLGDANETYPASTLVIRKQFVDAAIDELKREHHKERDEYIDWVNRMQKEYAELKEVYKESVDVKVKIWERCKKAEDEIRRQKRALYKACANWAKSEERINFMNAYDASEYQHSMEDIFRKKAERWSEMERKCRAKAEEFV